MSQMTPELHRNVNSRGCVSPSASVRAAAYNYNIDTTTNNSNNAKLFYGKSKNIINNRKKSKIIYAGVIDNESKDEGM